MSELEILNAVKQFGFFAVLVALFIWRDWAREQRMSKRLDEQQDQFVKTLTDLVSKANDAQNRNAETLRDMVDELKRRPCMMGFEPQHKR